MKEKKGITLIALIITVIVLLILAGVAISIAINGGDIFGKASQARDAWNLSVETEQEKIDDVLNLLNTMTNGTTPQEPTPEPGPVGQYPVYAIGTEVSIGTDRFYVFAANDSTQSDVVLIAKYTLDVDGEEQAINADTQETECPFSETYYWGDAWGEYYADWVYPNPYLDINNVSGYGENDAIAKAKAYAKAVTGDVNNNSGRLPTLEEVEALKNDYENMIFGLENSFERSNNWENFSSNGLEYWTSTTYDEEEILFQVTGILNLRATETCGYDNYAANSPGVRPVLTVPKSMVTLVSQ